MTVHKKKHEQLSLKLPTSLATDIVDQTPTPSRDVDINGLLKNINDVGLFSDLGVTPVPEATSDPSNPSSQSENVFFKKVAKKRPEMRLNIPDPAQRQDESLNTPYVPLPTSDVLPSEAPPPKQSVIIHSSATKSLISETEALSPVNSSETTAVTVPVIAKPNAVSRPKRGNVKNTSSAGNPLNARYTLNSGQRSSASGPVLFTQNGVGLVNGKLMLPKPPPGQPQNPVYQIIMKLPDGHTVQVPLRQGDQVPATNGPMTSSKLSKVTSKPVDIPSSSQGSIDLTESNGSQSPNSDSGSNPFPPRGRPSRRNRYTMDDEPSNKKARSLERNREAAMRCRKKRKQWVQTLDEKAQELEQLNESLQVST